MHINAHVRDAIFTTEFSNWKSNYSIHSKLPGTLNWFILVFNYFGFDLLSSMNSLLAINMGISNVNGSII